MSIEACAAARPLLKITDLRVTIEADEGDAKVLDHVSIEVKPGRIVGLVGESGCGKSTTIAAILRILPEQARIKVGSIEFEGRDILAMDEKDVAANIRGKKISFIPQDPYLAFNPVFPVGSQLLEIMRWHAEPGPANESAKNRRKRHSERLISLFRKVQLPEPETILDRYPHQFSGGQRQRLFIAAALSCSPKLIIADEPTTALDVTTQNEILTLLKELSAEMDVSMLFVTHDLGVVARLCDDMAVMYAGQTVEFGRTRDVLDRPSHPYTKALVDCHPDKSVGFVGIPGTVPSPFRAPPGCRFKARCEVALPQCAEREPALRRTPDNRLVDCIRFDGEPVLQGAVN